MRWFLLALAACGTSASPPAVPRAPAGDPTGPHAAAVTAQVQPYLEGEVLHGVVVGLYEGGKREVYGFGVGPDGKGRPTGDTLFEIGSVTKVFTGLLLADSVQRKEVDLDMPVADLLPPGVTVPGKDKQVITLRHLVLHASALPRLPPSIRPGSPDPYAAYGENELYRDLVSLELPEAPGTTIRYSNLGAGLLGFAIARRAKGNYAEVLARRILQPLKLSSTYVSGSGALAGSSIDVTKAPAARRARGTTADLAEAAPWTFDALAGAGALVSSVNDMLAFIDAQVDAEAGGRSALRGAMRFSLEPQLAQVGGANHGLGWAIDEEGRYWHNGETGGFAAFVMFSPRNKRGVVVLASTASTLVDRIALALMAELEGQPEPPAVFPTPEELAPLAGVYDLAGTKLEVTVSGKRLYVVEGDSPRTRLVPLSATQFLIAEIDAPVIFEREGDTVARMIILVGGNRMVAPRVASPASPN